LDLQQVQADEIKGKGMGHSFWMAMALMVPTRLWLGSNSNYGLEPEKKTTTV